METGKTGRSVSTMVLVALVLATGAIASTYILCTFLLRAKRNDDIIRVVGSARKAVRSDFIIWSGTVTQNAQDTVTGYASLQSGMAKARKFLLDKKVPEADITLSSIRVETLYAPLKKDEVDAAQPGGSVFRTIVGYKLTQSINVASHDVDRVDSLARQSTSLINEGLDFESQTPQFLNTKISELKVTMQAEAAKDARSRAEQIARNAGCQLGEVRYARMSAPSITPLYSQTEDDGGTDDTTSRDKKITAVVSIGYAPR